MQTDKHRKWVIFIESGFGILMLAIACIILSNLFLTAANGSRISKEKSSATAKMAYLLEVASADVDENIQPDNDATMVFYYDASWQQTERQDAAYRIEIKRTQSEKPAGVLNSYTAVSMRSDGSEIARTSAARYVPFPKGELE